MRLTLFNASVKHGVNSKSLTSLSLIGIEHNDMCDANTFDLDLCLDIFLLLDMLDGIIGTLLSRITREGLILVAVF